MKYKKLKPQATRHEIGVPLYDKNVRERKIVYEKL